MNEFLRPDWQQTSFVYPTYDGTQSVKHLVESIGVPHTEVDLILCNGEPVSFAYLVQERDRVTVFPAFTTLQIDSGVPLRPPYPRKCRFLLDNHLGRLARYLRLLGFDTLYFNNNYNDAQLAEIAQIKACILLTRDRGLLKRSQITYGYYLHSTDPQEQVRAVLHRFRLYDQTQPWRRCLRCNGLLHPVAKEKIVGVLEPKTKLYYHHFRQCADCGQLYWKGSHFSQLESFVAEIRAAATYASSIY